MCGTGRGDLHKLAYFRRIHPRRHRIKKKKSEISIILHAVIRLWIIYTLRQMRIKNEDFINAFCSPAGTHRPQIEGMWERCYPPPIRVKCVYSSGASSPRRFDLDVYYEYIARSTGKKKRNVNDDKQEAIRRWKPQMDGKKKSIHNNLLVGKKLLLLLSIHRHTHTHTPL